MSCVNGHATYFSSPISMLWETWLTHLAPNLTPPPPLAINIYGSRFLRLQMKGIFLVVLFLFWYRSQFKSWKICHCDQSSDLPNEWSGGGDQRRKITFECVWKLRKKDDRKIFTNILEEHHLSAHYFPRKKKKNPNILDFKITVRKWISCYELITVKVLNGTQRFFFCFN